MSSVDTHVTKRGWKAVLRGVALGLPIVALLLVLALQSDWATRLVLTRIARAATQVEDATVDASAIRGNRLTSLRIVDLTVVLGEWGELARVDSLELSYRLFPLLRSAVAIERARLVGAKLDLRDCALRWLDRRAPADTTQPGWTVDVASLEIGGVRATGGDCAEQSWSVADGVIHATSIGTSPSLGGRIDLLRMGVTPASVGEDYRADVRFAGSLLDGSVHVDSLVVRSPDSDFAASGVLRALTAPSDAPDIDFRLVADPLALRDVQPFADFLATDGVLRAEVSLSGASDVVDVEADVRIEGGGSARVQASLSEADGDYLRYRGEALVDGFDPSRLLSAAPAGPVHGAVEFDVAGSTVEHLSGRANGALRRDSDPDGARLEADAVLADGRAEVSGRAEGLGAAAGFEGWIRPFSVRREGELSGDFNWIVSGPSEPRARLSGRYEVALAFEDLSRPTGSADVDIAASSLVRATIDEASVGVELVDGIGTWQLSAAVEEGRVEAGGSIDLVGETLGVDAARMLDLDLSALTAAPPPTVVSGTVSGRRVGGVSGVGDWVASVALARSSVGALSVDSATADVVLEGDRLRADVRAGAAAADVDAHVEGTLGPAGRFTVSLSESSYRRLVVDSGTIELRPKAETLDIRADLFASDGALHVRGRRDGDAGRTRWRVDEANFTELDLGALLDSGQAESLLSGRLSGSWRGGAPAAATGELDLTLGTSTIAGWPVDSATVEASIDEGRSRWTVSVESADVGGGAVVELDFLETPARAEGTGRFRGHVRDVTVDSAHAAFRYQAGELRADTLNVWSPELTGGGRAVAAVRPGPVRIASASLAATVTGLAPLASWFGLEVERLELAEVNASAVGFADSLDVTADVSLVDLAYGTVDVAAASGTGRARYVAGAGLSRLGASAELGSIVAAGVPVERAQVHASPEGAAVAVSVEAIFDSTRNASASGLVMRQDETTEIRLRSLDAEVGAQRWTLEDASTLRVGEAIEVHDLRLGSPSGRIAADGIVGGSGEQRLRLDVEGLELGGLSDVLGYQGLQGEVDGSLLLAGTAEAPRVDGSLSARGTLRETAPAILDAEIHYELRAIDLEAGLQLGGVPTGRLAGRVPFELSFAQTDGAAPQARAGDGPVDLEVTAERLDLQWLVPWLPPDAVRDVTGTLGTRVRLRGTVDELRPEGSVTVVGAGAFVNPLGIQLAEGTGTGRFVDDRFVIELAEIYSGGGSLAVSGNLRASGLGPGALDLEVVLDDFVAVRTELGRATVDGELTVGGTTAEPSIEGRIDVLTAEVFLGGRFAGSQAEAVELTAEDLAMLEERFGYVPPSALLVTRTSEPGSAALDLDVTLGRNTWVRRRANPLLSVQLSGDLRVEKDHGELERVYGRLNAVPRGSFVEQFGRRFDITTGTVDFNGPPQELRFDVTGRYEVPTRGDPTANEVVIDLGVVGGLNDLGLELSSDPEMENADIVSYLATGRPASETMQFGGNGRGQVVEQGATLALGAATTAFERFASENVGLDVVQIRSEGVRGATLVAGRYVSPRLYLGFKQPIGHRKSREASVTQSRSPEVEIEYEAFRWLLLNLQREGSRLDFFLRSRYAY